jgi:hypothetical protein
MANTFAVGNIVVLGPTAGPNVPGVSEGLYRIVGLGDGSTTVQLQRVGEPQGGVTVIEPRSRVANTYGAQ